MLLHFIFVIKEEDLPNRKEEFQYIRSMAKFFQKWIQENFSKSYEIQCDEMITEPRSILQKLDSHTLLDDHRQRGKEIYHFYLTHFRPLWTDCTCEGFHAENFGMALWQKPKNGYDEVFLAEKNCTTVCHEILHEMLRQKKHKRYIEDVHDLQTQHLFNNLPFIQYDKDYKVTENKPKFLSMDISTIKY